LESWRATHNGQVPKTTAEKNEFKGKVKALSRDIGKEMNFDEAIKNIHKCY
jgi:NEDD8-activating enzyme E1 regulatory subunit